MFNSISLRTTLTFILLSLGQNSSAESVLIAVASNFSKPMTEIAAAFEKTTGHSAKLSFGSTGSFVSQLENGAPFEVLLSADETSTVKLELAGLAVPDSHFTYALGKLALWSTTPGYVDEHGKILASGNFKHLALASPTLAPYGVAALDVLKSLNLQNELQPLFVQGENIAQTYQFISTGNAELGFVALSQVIGTDIAQPDTYGKITTGSGWIIPTVLYTPIRQDAVLMTKGANNPAALALLDYLKSATALMIIQKFGYELPK
jgi:molybdate transport system substrate-binding protein